MGILKKLKKAKDITGTVSTAITSAPKAAKTFGATLYSEGKKEAATPGTAAYKFTRAPGGFTYAAPKPVRGAAGLVLPTPGKVVSAYSKTGAKGFREQLGVNLQIATAPLAAAGAGKAVKATSAFARSPRFGAILAEAGGDLGMAGSRKTAGGTLRTAADLAMSRARTPKARTGQAVAAATQRITQAATGAPTPVVARAASVAKSAPKLGRIGSIPGRIVKSAYIEPVKDVARAGSRIRRASGIGGKVKAAGAVAAHTPGFALKVSAITLPVTAAGAGAVLETKNQVSDAFHGGRKTSASKEPAFTDSATGLAAVAKVYKEKGDIGITALVEGLKEAQKGGLGVLREEPAKKLLRSKVKKQYNRARIDYLRND